MAKEKLRVDSTGKVATSRVYVRVFPFVPLNLNAPENYHEKRASDDARGKGGGGGDFPANQFGVVYKIINDFNYNAVMGALLRLSARRCDYGPVSQRRDERGPVYVNARTHEYYTHALVRALGLRASRASV